MRRASGQTIMELLLAMFVISVGLFSAVTLVYSNLALVDRDTDEVVVVNLAREGVELAKEARDSNWLAGNPFDTGLVGPNGAPNSDYTATPIWDGVVTTPSFDFTADSFLHGNAQIVQSTNPAAPLFLANTNTAPPIAGNATVFKRLITFHPICNDYSILDTPALCADTGHTKIGVRVDSHVQWTRKGIAKDLTIYSDLYDWR